MTNEQWTQELQQKMTGYRRPAPDVSWDELDHALAVGKSRKMRRFRLQRIAAAAVILLIAGVGYWGFLYDDAVQTLPTTASVGNQPIDATSQGDRHTVRSGNHLTGCLSPCEVAEVSVSEPETVTPVSVEDTDTLHITATEEQQQPRGVEEKVQPTKKNSPVIYPSDLRQRQHLENRLTAKVYMSSAMAGSLTESFGAQIGYASHNLHQDSVQHIHHLQDSVQHIHHRQPVRIGLSLRYRLDTRWSIETGLSYTRLSSDITTIEDGVTTMTEQRLNYIGMPLNISYNLWRNRYLELYITSGAMIEKRLDASPWQFSFNVGAGAEYKLTNYVSLYAEPSLGYYFKDGSATPTIYQDHPLIFNLSFGLRFNLQ